MSPIGKEGTKQHTAFKEVLDYVIKPAFEESGYKYSVVRADDINRSGSFIKDILESIYSAHVVVADLTGQNPNVFYELGVRHSLRPRTILIAHNLDDIPSDLREYRTIIYDTSAKGASAFKKRIKQFLTEIHKEPDRPDNPVLDRLGNMTEDKLSQIESERDSLKAELSNLLSGKTIQKKKQIPSDVRKRFKRILTLKNGKYQGVLGGHFTRGEEEFTLPNEQGNFQLYFLTDKDSISAFWYVAVHGASADIEEELADIRVLMENCSKGQDVACDFIIVVGQVISDKPKHFTLFQKMKKHIDKNYGELFRLHLLDPPELEVWEKDLGLKV